MERIVRTPDGRTLAVQEGGDPAGRPLLVHPGTPTNLVRGTSMVPSPPMPAGAVCG